MTEGYDNTNNGALFRNTDKDDAHPNWADYQGSQNVQCPKCGQQTDYWLSAWLKTAKKTGQKFMSTAVKVKENRAPKQEPGMLDVDDSLDQDIPF